MDSGHLFLQRVSLLLGLLQLCLKLSDLGNITGGLKKTRQRSDVFKVKVRPPGQGPYLSNEGFVLLHQFVKVLLVLLQPLEQVRLLVLQQTQLLVSLQDDTIVSEISGSDHLCHLFHSPHPSGGRCSPARSACSPTPGTEWPGCPQPPDVWLRSPPAN